jgi:hypothetical protein
MMNKSLKRFLFQWKIYYRRGKGPGLLRLEMAAQILDYWLEYTDLAQSGQAIL